MIVRGQAAVDGSHWTDILGKAELSVNGRKNCTWTGQGGGMVPKQLQNVERPACTAVCKRAETGVSYPRILHMEANGCMPRRRDHFLRA
jgi:hypothetical protein